MPSAEILLMAGILGLYLYDASLLLFCNEGILSPAKRGWNVAFGSDKMRLLGKETVLLDPLLIHRPAYRLSWHFEREGQSGNWVPAPGLYTPLLPMLAGVALGLLVLLPLGFFTAFGTTALAAALLLVFPSIIAALVWVWLNREALSLTTGRFAQLAFELLVCPPFALNMVRHLSLNAAVGEDLLSAAKRLQTEEQWNKTRRQCLLRLREAMEAEEPDSDRYRRLHARHQSLAEEGEDVRF